MLSGLLGSAAINVAAHADASDLAAGTTASAATLEQPTDEELLVLIDVNQQRLDQAAIVLRDRDGALWVPAAIIDRARLRHPESPLRQVGGVSYYPLAALAGAGYEYDAATLRLVITARPEAFAESLLTGPARHYPSPMGPPPGGFFNYELFAARASGDSQFAGQFEGGLFNRNGVLVAGMLAQPGADARRAVRLDTTWTSDFPSRMTTLRLGDAINAPGAWGRAVRFGGVQYGVNFATQPGFVTFPTVAANGQAALPSTVDVFVNNALVAQRTVPPGPFSITNIPTISGGGNVELVVRDLFGREQLVSQPFFASASLLQAGLADYSYEAGFERNNFGAENADYGRALAGATYRYGLTDQLTAEARGEWMRGQIAMGAAAEWLVAHVGVVRGAMATSRAAGGRTGSLVSLGYQQQSGPWNVGAQVQRTSHEFRQIGSSADNPPPRFQSAATLGYQLETLGNVGVTYVRQDREAQQDLRLLSLGYSVTLGRFGTFNLSAAKRYGSDGSVAVTATLTIPWGEHESVSLSRDTVRGRANGNANDSVITVQRNLPSGDGYGYRLLAHARDDLAANLTLQNEVGRYAFDLSHFQSEVAARASVAGGVGYLGGHTFASRPITNSFAVVRVDDYPSVGVLFDNQPAGRTDANGYAVLPQLRAYDVNPISIAQGDLPLDANVDRLQVDAVPYYRSGVLLDFPVRRSHGATFRIRLDDGGDMPAGATVEVAGSAEKFPVALEGLAYVTGLGPRNRVRARWNGQSCEFRVDVPSSSDPLPDLGTFFCGGVAR